MMKFAFWQRARTQSLLPDEPNRPEFTPITWSRIFLGGMTIALAMVGYCSYQIVRHQKLEQLKANALLAVKAEVNTIDGWLALHAGKVKTLAYSPQIHSMEWSTVKPYLQSEAARVQGFHKFLYVQPDGQYYTTEAGKVLGKSLADRPSFQQAMQGQLTVSPPYTSDTLRFKFISILTPIYPPGNLQAQRRPVGVLGGAVKVDKMRQIIEKLQYGRGSYAFVIDQNGDYMIDASPQQPASGQPAAQRHQKQRTQLALTIKQQQKQGIQLERIDHQLQYVAYVPLQEANWSVALVIPRHVIEHQLSALDLIVASTATLSALMLAFLWRVQQKEGQRLKSVIQRDKILHRLTAQIRQSLNFEEILETTLHSIQEVFHLSRVGFVWHHQASSDGDWHVAKLVESDSAHQSVKDCPLQRNLLPHTEKLLRGQTVTQVNPQAVVKSALYVPMATVEVGKTAALICENWQQAYTWKENEIELIEAVSEQLAIALNQVGLFEQTQTKATELEATLKELRLTQMQMIQTEKMSSLGQMVAGVAHEINNPVTFIHSNLKPTQEYTDDLLNLIQLYQTEYPEPSAQIQQEIDALDLDFVQQDLRKIMQSMTYGTQRIRDIILNLREFVQLDQDGIKAIDIHEGLSGTVMLLQNRLRAQNGRPEISVIQRYGDLPWIECYADKLNQVFMSILSNAIDAFEPDGFKPLHQTEAPTIRIETAPINHEQVQITIANNGPPIPPHIQLKLFDPFFTTKPIGQATGMGLPISYQIIVDQHHGQLECQSDQAGVAFVMTLPIQLAATCQVR